MKLAHCMYFNSRTSCEVRLRWGFPRSTFVISTHAPLARCDCALIYDGDIARISTHAPLARCDSTLFWVRCMYSISTHAPLARCDARLQTATNQRTDFNSRTSCEVRLGNGAGYHLHSISTHAPLARCDIHRRISGPDSVSFQLTHLLRGAT